MPTKLTDRINLTDKFLEKKKPPASGRVEIWDKGFRGSFGVRVTDKGTKTFQLMYRFDGNLRRKTLGQYPVISLADARDAAEKIVRSAKKGIDPELAEDEAAAERKRQQANTFGAVVDQFIELYAKPKNKSWKEVKRYFERDLADWVNRPISTITRRDVIEVIDRKAREGGPYAANRLRAHTRRLFSWMLGRDLIAASPVVNVQAVGAEQSRERVLGDDEIRRLWAAWDRMEWPFGPVFQILLATGQRRTEAASMKWSDIRVGPAAETPPSATVTPIEWMWTIPGTRTKSGRLHEVPLSEPVLDVLGSVPRTTSPYVFPARGNGERFASGYSRAKMRCDELSKVTGWRIHDLRRTCGTGMASAGIAVSTISRVLNHAEGGVTKIYNRYSYGSEKRHALEVWARKLETIIRPAPDNVVDMMGARHA